MKLKWIKVAVRESMCGNRMQAAWARQIMKWTEFWSHTILIPELNSLSHEIPFMNVKTFCPDSKYVRMKDFSYEMLPRMYECVRNIVAWVQQGHNSKLKYFKCCFSKYDCKLMVTFTLLLLIFWYKTYYAAYQKIKSDCVNVTINF